MGNRRIKPVAAAVGTAFVASLASVGFADTSGELFVTEDLGSGYALLAQADSEGKGGEGTCGQSADADAKDAEGGCGAKDAEGGCGAKDAEGGCGAKDAEGGCGAKDAEGACGAA